MTLMDNEDLQYLIQRELLERGFYYFALSVGDQAKMQKQRSFQKL